MANLNFDATTVEPSTEFEVLPAGKYLAIITESEMKPTKNLDGAYLELKFQIIEGEHKGRVLISRLNLDNTNAKAVQIAKSELSAICRAVGVMKPEDSSELHDLPLLITVKTRKREDNGELANEIKGYAPKESASGQPQQSDGLPPWAKR